MNHKCREDMLNYKKNAFSYFTPFVQFLVLPCQERSHLTGDYGVWWVVCGLTVKKK